MSQCQHTLHLNLQERHARIQNLIIQGTLPLLPTEVNGEIRYKRTNTIPTTHNNQDGDE